MGGRDWRIPISSQASQAHAAQATDRACLRQDGRSDLTLEVVVWPPHARHAPCSSVCFLLLEHSFFLSLESSHCSGLRLHFIVSDWGFIHFFELLRSLPMSHPSSHPPALSAKCSGFPDSLRVLSGQQPHLLPAQTEFWCFLPQTFAD